MDLLYFLAAWSKKDKESPVITLIGDSKITLTYGQPFNDPGVNIFDNSDKTLKPVVGDDKVDTNKFGIYVITYNAAYSTGNKATEVKERLLLKKVLFIKLIV
ncbi:immunoglobulin-like domain-containing protein [Clostridium colicanis]|uniref:Pesticidal crystal protein Cry22Aa Ig-like domain-containing protein n=1 Tax=Clostridium colicanis DSM 13634 TaxID=1121305 RepID=A0A151AQ09_9CLOT|nr:immunoglobulin-like domain-containing protein [Clostridium colicanis]KYH29487.1 hypothetical protein CLCOL_07180 [Clostridium colicanis DSM 13634]